MDISIVITAIGTVVSFAGIMCAIFRNFKMDNEKKFDEIRDEIKNNKYELKDQMQKNHLDSSCHFSTMNERFINLQYRLDNRFDSTDKEIKEIRTSVNRLEGAFYSQDCCMLKGEKKPKKKAE